MKMGGKLLLTFLVTLVAFIGHAQDSIKHSGRELYRSADLVIIQVSENSFEHVSYLQTDDFGNVPCNGLIVRNGKEVVVFDTPVGDKSAAELIEWIGKTLGCRINAIVPTHFHNDCLSGLEAFHQQNIPSYASNMTIELARQNNFPLPKNGFGDSLLLKLGSEHVIIQYFGEGHTRDNVVGYFPAEKVLFGGCLVKELSAGKGFLGDANIAEWSTTVEKLRRAYPDIRLVVPGHGKYGDASLLDYTIKLFR